jgi:hypothetical protein
MSNEMEGTLRKKLGMLSVNISDSSKGEAADGNCYNTEAKPDLAMVNKVRLVSPDKSQ